MSLLAPTFCNSGSASSIGQAPHRLPQKTIHLVLTISLTLGDDAHADEDDDDDGRCDGDDVCDDAYGGDGECNGAQKSTWKSTMENLHGNWVGIPTQEKHMTNRSRRGSTHMKTQQIQICLRGRN